MIIRPIDNNYYGTFDLFENVKCVEKGMKGIHSKTYIKPEVYYFLAQDNENYQMEIFYQNQYIQKLENENRLFKDAYYSTLEQLVNTYTEQIETNFIRYNVSKSDSDRRYLIKTFKEIRLFLENNYCRCSEPTKNLLTKCVSIACYLFNTEKYNKDFQNISSFLYKVNQGLLCIEKAEKSYVQNLLKKSILSIPLDRGNVLKK